MTQRMVETGGQIRGALQAFPFPYIHRDISWLSFNYRVLQEARDERVPLLERLKFLAIYSNNLGEFFQVRVASNRNLIRIGKKTKRELDFDPKEVVRRIIEIVRGHMIEFSDIFEHQLVPALKEHGIHLLRRLELNEEQRAFVEEYFVNHLLPYVQPILLNDKVKPFLANAVLYLALDMREKDAREVIQYALVQVPSNYLPRFVLLPSPPGEHHVIMLDDVVRHNISTLLPGYDIVDAYSIKLTRDAELYIDDEYSGNLLEKIKKSLQKRNVGPASRLVYDREMPRRMLRYLMKMLELEPLDLIPESRYHNNFDFFHFPDFGKKELKYRPMPPIVYGGLKDKRTMFERIAERDHLLMTPYHDYETVIQLFEKAAEDPLVTHIKIIQYRVSPDSRIMNALCRAVKNGKRVFVFIEVKARFDEEANLRWGEKLEKEGVHVRYSLPGLKVHAKAALIRRYEDEEFREYCYIGTGNFNERTAVVYSDFGLFTADERITSEMVRFFHYLEKQQLPSRPFQHLLVGQFNLFSELQSLIDYEIAQARQGKKALILLKLNSLQDPLMVEKLYEASRAGVEVRLIVRSICSLVPQVEGWSDRIEAISIVDRFLEHSRVYYFYAGGEEKLYLSSADWMVRNLHRRIELAVPLYAPHIRQQVMDVLDLQWRDNVKARILDAQMENAYRTPAPNEPIVRSQYATYDYFKNREQLYGKDGSP